MPASSRFYGCSIDILIFLWLLTAHRFAHHNIHSQFFARSSFQVDFLAQIETQLAVDDEVDVVRTLQVAWNAISVGLWVSKSQRFCVNNFVIGVLVTYHLRHILNQLPSVSPTPRLRLSTDIIEIPRIGIPLPENLLFAVVQQGQELIEEAGPAFLGQFPAQTPHAASQDGEPVIDILARGQPKGHAVEVVANGQDQSLQTVGVGDVLHGRLVHLETLLLGQVHAVGCVDGVAHDVVHAKCFGETGGGFFVLVGSDDADAIFVRGRRLRAGRASFLVDDGGVQNGGGNTRKSHAGLRFGFCILAASSFFSGIFLLLAFSLKGHVYVVNLL